MYVVKMPLAKNNKQPARTEKAQFKTSSYATPRPTKKNKARPRPKRGKGRSKVGTSGGASVARVMRDNPPLFPPSLRRRGMLYYEYQLSLSGAAGTVQSYVFSANGMFDPNITGTGHQPMGFDNMMALYEHYVVDHCHCKITIQSNQATGQRVVLYVNPDTTPVTPFSNIIENGLAVTTTVEGKSGDGHHSMKTLELAANIPALYGKSMHEILADSELRGTAAANPTEQSYFVIAVTNAFDSTGTPGIYVDVILSFDVTFLEPRKLAAS